MANDKPITNKPEPDDADIALDSGNPDLNKPDLDAPVKSDHKTRNVPTMMKPVIESPENIDLDLLNVPILTNIVEQNADDSATQQDLPSGHEN